MRISIKDEIGDFAEDKNAAATLRDDTIAPAVAEGNRVTLDFRGVTLATQSCIHAMISDVLRTHGEDALQCLEFKSCKPVVKGVIGTVVQYSLESMSDE